MLRQIFIFYIINFLQELLNYLYTYHRIQENAQFRLNYTNLYKTSHMMTLKVYIIFFRSYQLNPEIHRNVVW